ncbi:MAG: hypothetical protein WBA31_10870 [Candidatus Dormiibacterota bacterium]
MSQQVPGTGEGEGDGFSSTGLLEFEEQTEVGELYLRALMHRQGRLSLGIALAFAGFLLLQPLLAWWWPEWGRLRLLGIPVSWLLLGVLSYPLLVWLGSIYVRRAEEVDDEFTDLLRGR